MFEDEQASLESTIEEAIRAELAVRHTLYIAEIVSYNKSLQKADVQPIVRGRRRSEDDPEVIESYQMAPVTGLPVRWERSGAGSMVGDLQPGDTVLVMCVERSIADWLQEGNSDTEPTSFRRWSMQDGVVLPGPSSFASPLPPDAWAAGAYTIKAADLRLGDSTATSFVALATLVDARFTALSAWMTQVQIWMAAHLHPVSGAAAGPSVVPPAPNPPTLPSVAATKVKAK